MIETTENEWPIINNYAVRDMANYKNLRCKIHGAINHEVQKCIKQVNG